MKLISSNKYKGVYRHELKSMYKGRQDFTFYITYYNGKKKCKEKVGKKSDGITEKFCNEFRQKRLSDIRTYNLTHEHKQLSSKEYTLDEIFALYKLRKHANRDIKRSEQKYNTKLQKRFGSTKINSIRRDDVYEFRNDLIQKGYSNATINSEIGFLATLFNLAIEEQRYFMTNPAKIKKEDRLKVDNERYRTFTVEEIKLLKDTLIKKGEEQNKNKNDFDELLLFVKLSLSLGGRLKTICNIKYCDITHEKRSVMLYDFKSSGTYTGYIADFEIYDAINHNLEHRDNSDKNKTVIKMNSRTLQRKLKNVIDELFNKDLDVKDTKNRAVLHTLRHTFGTLLVADGVPIYDVQKLMNHKDIRQTARYSKHSDENSERYIGNLTTAIKSGKNKVNLSRMVNNRGFRVK